MKDLRLPRAGTMVLLLAVFQGLCMLLSLALTGGILYVAWHFIRKHW